ncbi:MAG: hypothetical protein U9P90_00995, partial [Patescibacteria group bacterium]|nr:hypothetical protein [Patescibacteria group bacterium]
NFSKRGDFYLTKQERARVERVVMESESPGERLSVIQEWLRADRKALDFLERVLNDEERMTAFFRGEEIPLRKVPHCCKSYK